MVARPFEWSRTTLPRADLTRLFSAVVLATEFSLAPSHAKIVLVAPAITPQYQQTVVLRPRAERDAVPFAGASARFMARPIDPDSGKRKSGRMAGVLAYLFPGAGYFYAGEPGRALLTMALAGGGFLVGMSDAQSQAVAEVSLVGALGVYIISVVDAPFAAKRYNRRHAHPAPPIQPLRDTSTAVVTQPVQDKYGLMRKRMVDEQIRARGIRDTAVLRAMSRVPRHRFVPRSIEEEAYTDSPLPIGLDQTISQPYIVAYMTEAAQITPGEKVLEIGTGSGYQAAVLAEITPTVYSVELLPALANRARNILTELRYTNIRLRTGDGYAGWKEHAPFDAIIVTAAPEQVPPALVEQLAINGRMVIPVGGLDQQMRIITRTARGVVEERTIDVMFVPLVRPDSLQR